MNAARMNSLLIRQKHNMVNDALYALMVAVGLVIYLLGLGLGTSAGTTNESYRPALPAPVVSPVEQADSCPPDSADTLAQLC